MHGLQQHSLKTVSPKGATAFVHQNSLPLLPPKIATKTLVHQSSLPTIVSPKPIISNNQGLPKKFLPTTNPSTTLFSSPTPTKQGVPSSTSPQANTLFASPKPIGTTKQGSSLSRNSSNETKTTTTTTAPSSTAKPCSLPGFDPDLKFGAKPSEIRAAAKQNRDKAKVDHSRKDEVRKREEAAALRMKKIKDEIDAIKQKEQEESDREAVAAVDRERFDFNEAKLLAKALETGAPRGVVNHHQHSKPTTVKEDKATNSSIVPRKNEHVKPVRPPPAPARKRSNVEAEAVSRGTKELALEEMMAERRSVNQQKKEEEDEQQPPRRQLSDMNMPMDELMHFQQAIPSGDTNPNLSISAAVLATAPPPPAKTSLEATPTGKLRKVPARRGVERTPSNRIPEMRRRANQRDLLFDDDDKHRASSAPTSTSGGATSKVVPAAEGTSKSSMIAAREALDAAKVEDERKISMAQKAELDKAKAHFDKGHDLCWKDNDSAGALVDYRKALFTRESVLGKYHEETGRSYFWIGKSLTKLKDFDEALMAFSRAMRIFERVLKKSNKYNIWTVTAIEGVFRQMDDPDADCASYKERLEASIRREQSGDQLRKRGKLAEAIVEYREAIDNLDEYHPDAADLYCKIAIIMRQQGEFDRALEEYRYASEIYELSLGAEHPETVKTLNQLIEKKRLNQKSLALMEKLKLRN